MRTREQTRGQAPERSDRFLSELGRTAATAGVGLTACVLLIAAGALVSLSWHVHPLLCPLALLALLWAAARLLGALLANRPRRAPGAPDRG
jgi:type IV secretory pathway VirB3-like protein